jgi:hypothetical protein
VASVGSRGDSYDNALAEAVNGLYKAELIGRHGPWRTVEQVELATLAWVQCGTNTACTARSATSHPQNTKPSTTVSTNSPRRSRNPNRPGLHQSQDSSVG